MRTSHHIFLSSWRTMFCRMLAVQGVLNEGTLEMQQNFAPASVAKRFYFAVKLYIPVLSSKFGSTTFIKQVPMTYCKHSMIPCFPACYHGVLSEWLVCRNTEWSLRTGFAFSSCRYFRFGGSYVTVKVQDIIYHWNKFGVYPIILLSCLTI